MKTAELIANAKAESGLSQRGIARVLGIDNKELIRAKNGERELTYEHAMKLAELAGLPPQSTAARILASTAKSKDVRDMLMRIAKTAAAVLLCVIAKSGQSHTFTNVSFDIKDTQYTYALVHVRVQHGVGVGAG